MTSAVGHDEDSPNGQFIAGWKINRISMRGVRNGI